MIVLTSVSLKAIVAINRLIGLGNEGNCGGVAAFSANRVIRNLFPGLSSALCSAFFAACGVVLKAFFCVKFLFTGGEYEFLTAILASENSVFKHLWIFL